MTELFPGRGRTMLAAAATVVLWASAFVVIRIAGAEFSPGALALGRLASAAVVLVALLLLTGTGLPPRSALRGVMVSGVLWFGIYMVALNWAEQHVDAGTAALVINTGPLMIALLGGLFLGEGFPRRLMAGIAVAFTGAAVVGSSSSEGAATLLGVVLCVVAAVAWAVAVLVQKPALAHASALQVTTGGCVVGTLACLPFTGQLVTEAAAAPLPATLALVYLGVFPTAVAFTTWAYALARMTAGQVGATTYAVPALVVVMSWLLLDEVPGPPALAGGVLCLAGVAITRWRPRARRGAAARRDSDREADPV
ncbi:DMT family transporter [Nocardia sp. NPDC004568]|uniref:DMT family transporter n=1 Tax=Nocardia sp. NPDC004568 TaxID=3154551 RepID=UPI0033ACFD56